ncbi:uncharacterized protein LOC112093226 [Morus notabilis]|uniref:uncharacterized protein LOC112093226 n=1 Tax=Morus notabilis TaxID=981085 RepID=UPI000CED0F5D|nr:uncharacterized protein LOC112093226 [Morus notabilis]
MHLKGNSLEDTIKAFMDTQNKMNQRVDSMLTQLVEENKEIKSQITKLTEALTIQERGKFPSQAQSNLRGQHMAQTSNSKGQNIKKVNAISTRSCKNFDTPSTSTTTSSNEESAQEKKEPTKIPVKVPFPQALRPPGKVPENQSEILEHLTQLKINLPLLHKTLPKCKDPCCPTISCQIGTQEFGKALLDLGSSVNLMPYSVYSQLSLREIKPTSVVLQLADRSIKRPQGIVEDVLLQVDKFYYPLDFLVLDTQSVEEVQLQSNYEDLENLLQNSDSKNSGSAELAHLSAIFSSSQDRGTKFRPPCFEELQTEREKLKSSTEEAPKVKLAQLPEGLKHAFLRDEGTFPVIKLSKLDALQE